MTKWTDWLKMDISLKKQPKSKKLTTKEQSKLIQLFSNLFASGFTLSEMVTFLKRSQLVKDSHTQKMTEALLAGNGMADMMSVVGFSDAVVTQVSLADIHGNTHQSLINIQSYLLSMDKVKKKIIEVATYPFILLLFLIMIMLGLKNYLLPQLDKGNLATQLIASFPMIFLGVMALVVFLGIVLVVIARRLPRMTLVRRLSKIPLVGGYVKLYLSAYYAREWGNLVSQGVDLVSIVQLMKTQKSRLFQEIGQDLETKLLAGQAFHDTVLAYPFFLTELGLIIEYGEIKAKLGKELAIYADETWELFFYRLQRATQLIQPCVFILVALVIVMIYAAMLLPMYQNMEFNI
ncbi:competence type IV pilus assembly protein ComGB [Streptococcus sp. zg-JUN1979]|uniref:competence type IV pilus assembly protein ComGB n=1 Tax=Streptococcus sp. zg-JUN1979 TaxID=3391450 RepID=UPI0039A5D2E3